MLLDKKKTGWGVGEVFVQPLRYVRLRFCPVDFSHGHMITEYIIIAGREETKFVYEKDFEKECKNVISLMKISHSISPYEKTNFRFALLEKELSRNLDILASQQLSIVSAARRAFLRPRRGLSRVGHWFLGV